MHYHSAGAIILFLSYPLAAADQWIKLATPHFELYTTAGEKKGREAILYFEQVRSFFLQASPSKHVPEFPVRIVAFRSEKQYKPYRLNEFAIAYYTQTHMRDYIVMQDIAPEHNHVAIHEYTHLIVEHTGLKLPPWLNEGWAELYSTLKPLGNRAMIGDLIPGRVQTLQTDKWLDLQTLTSVDHSSRFYNERNKAGIFYAESWALVHMLYLSPTYRPNFSKFVVALASGQSAAGSMQVAFGRSIFEVQKDLLGYLHSSKLVGVSFDIHLEKSAEEAEASTPDEFNVNMTLADLLAANRKTELAKQEYERLAKENPEKPEVEESLGYLSWIEKDTDGARRHFAKAIAAGTKNAKVCYEYAMFERRVNPTSDAAMAALERAVELKPDYTEARLQFGLMKLNKREWAAALGILGQIKNVNEEQAPWFFWGLAYAQLQTGGEDAARASIEKAKKYAKKPEDQRRVEEMERYIESKKRYDEAQKARGERASRPRESIPQQPLPATNEETAERPRIKRATTEPATAEQAATEPAKPVNPFVEAGQELKHVEGVATHLDCAGNQARLRISAGAKVLSFLIDDPKKVLIKHSGKITFDFTCGPQKPFGVAVDYIADSDPKKTSAGIVRGLEF